MTSNHEASSRLAEEARPAAPEIALIPGATGGIGLQIARALGDRGYRLLITGREAQRGRAAVEQIQGRGGKAEFLQVDHSSLEGLRALAAEVSRRTPRLDVLVNNVGGLFAHRQETADGLEATLAVNFVGPARLTQSLTALLEAAQSPRVVNVVSSALFMWRRGLLDDLKADERYVGIEAHAHAKLLNAIWTITFARKMAGRIAANAINPGMAWTPMTESLTPTAVPAWRYIWPLVRFFQRRASAETAAGGPAELACAKDVQATGRYFDNRKPKPLPPVARDEASQEQVWNLAASLGERG